MMYASYWSRPWPMYNQFNESQNDETSETTNTEEEATIESEFEEQKMPSVYEDLYA